MNYIFPFTITFIAGISTLIGYFIIYQKKYSKNKIIAYSLSFAASVMITISLIDLIPESYILLKKNHNNLQSILILIAFFNIGVIISLLLDYISNKSKNNNLYTIGIISMIAIILHNIPEGIITFIAGNTNKKIGISLMLAIALHNIPEGISIAIPIYYSTKNKIKAFLYTSISGLSEFLGAIIAFLFLKKINNVTFMGYMYAIIAGIMIFIAFFELIPTSTKLKEKKTFISFLLGILIMIISTFII